ncbi:MAG: DUF1737 domain-containing protein [Aureispira sp.]|nr:DUF1737 domain-containing protein [Aureispira sp.]
MEYTILKEDSTLKIKGLVQKYMAEGWMPQGGVAVTRYSNLMTYFHQAMTRTTEVDIAINEDK